MQCPTCPSLLVELHVGHIELDECPRCLGMWFDRGELTGFLAARLANRNVPQRYVPADPAAGEVRGNCPRCVVSRLTPKQEAEVTLSGCASCGGVWVPAPVVAALLNAPAPGPAVAPVASSSTEDADGGRRSKSEEPATTAPQGHGDLSCAERAHPEARAQMAEPSPGDAAAPARHSAPAQTLQTGCGVCGGAFEPVQHEGQSFHRCTSCQGLFFPRGGLPFFMGKNPRGWPLPHAGAPEPIDPPRCAACPTLMQPILFSGTPVRVYACTECWSMFASAHGVRRLIAPEQFMEESLRGPTMTLYRILDALTEWLVNPPKSTKYSVYDRPRR